MGDCSVRRSDSRSSWFDFTPSMLWVMMESSARLSLWVVGPSLKKSARMWVPSYEVVLISWVVPP